MAQKREENKLYDSSNLSIKKRKQSKDVEVSNRLYKDHQDRTRREEVNHIA